MVEFVTRKYRVLYGAVSFDEKEKISKLLSADYTIVYIDSGIWHMTVEGRSYDLRPSTLVQKKVAESMVLISANPTGNLWVLALWGEVPLLAGDYPNYDLHSTLAARPLGAYNVCPRNHINTVSARMAIFQLMTFRLEDYDKAYQQEVIEKYIYFLMSFVCQTSPQIQPQAAVQTPVEQCKRYINEHLAEDLTTKRLAQIFFLNPNYLTDLFTKETGISIRQYIISQRIAMANRLIEEGLSLSEVASQVGYKSYQGFYHAYQQVMGISPAAYQLHQ